MTSGPTIKKAISDVQTKRDREIAAHKAAIDRAEKHAEAVIKQLREICPHEDNGGFMHGFCKFCGEGGA